MNNPHLTPKDIERFLSKVEKRGPDECWIWTGTVTTWGYGQFKASGLRTPAHRVAFYLHNGWWADPCTCHHCDNRLCCNPAHLFAGTYRDNMQDMIRKGRNLTYGKPPIGSHCSHGHELTPENIFITSQGYRRCRVCKNTWMREVYKNRNRKKVLN